ncbi:MAG: hypothetical protein K2K54_07075 [Lachnospiraceae bacterium]|nr:hypothetical protein [Lachnospiraceae bacterium]
MDRQETQQYQEMKKKAVEKTKEVINLLLMEGKEEDFEKLYSIFNDENIMQFTMLDNDLFIIMRMAVLWFEENKAEISEHIFSSTGTIEDALELYKNITFSLYRLEQEVPLEYQDEAIQYLMGINISPIALWGMAEDKIINEGTFFKALTDGFYRNGFETRGNEMAKYKELKGKSSIYE